MRNTRYELVFITPDAFPDQSVRELTEKVQGLIEKGGGKMIRTDYWGRRTLAYEIQRNRRGYYVLLVFAGPGSMIAEIERNLKINENIIRFLTIKVEDGIDLDAVQPEPSQPAPADLFGERSTRRDTSGADDTAESRRGGDDDDDSDEEGLEA